MIVLGVSTSTARASAAVIRVEAGAEGQGCVLVLGRAEHAALREHAERLLSLIDEALAAGGVKRADIDAVACDVGPGSFTGVRVGLATAGGIALALQKPLVGVGSLEAMARAARELRPGAEAVLAAIDAKKDEVYLARFAGHALASEPPSHLPRADAERAITSAAQRGDLVVGEVADELAPGVACRLPECDLPDAVAVARRASELLARPEPVPAAEPLYVRAPDAKPAGERRS